MVLVHKHVVDDMTWHLIEITFPDFEVTLLDYGAAIYDIKTNNKTNQLETIVLQYQSLKDYRSNQRHLNATIGPTAGRIKDGQFTLHDVTYQLDKNFNGRHNLHGGRDALSHTQFPFNVLEEEDRVEVVFKAYQSASKSQYPGSQQYTIIYIVTPGEIEIKFVADTDSPTLVNLTNHVYFNLSGNLSSNILDHHMRIQSSTRLLLDDTMIPIKAVSNQKTPYDYQSMRVIRQDPLLEIDDPFLLDTVDSSIVQASLYDTSSGRQVDVYTTYPSIVVYTDNFPQPYTLAFGAPNERYMGICFECQNPPDGIHLDDQESSILQPGEDYYHQIKFVFLTRDDDHD